MGRRYVWLVSLLSVGSCGLIPCGADDLDVRFVPNDVTLAVGQTQTVRVELGSCHFHNKLDDQITWTSEDTAVATVDSLSGTITARGAGGTNVLAQAATYHNVGGVHVTVR